MTSTTLNRPATSHITMEDPGQSNEACRTTKFAVCAFAEAAIQPEPKGTGNAKAVKIGKPDETRFTMEDGGQSIGATATSQWAARLLAHLDDDEDDAKPSPNTSRPCDGRAPYCC